LREVARADKVPADNGFPEGPQMRCAAIMNATPVTVRADDSIAMAAGKLIAQRSTHLAVIDGEGCYVGSFGVDDLLGLMVPRVALAGSLAPNLRFIDENPERLRERFHTLKARPVGELADRNGVVLAPETPLIEAFRILCRGRVSLPVVEPASRKLVGSVSYWDVLATITAGA
jgi:CBS-domain-containing membrane protein